MKSLALMNNKKGAFKTRRFPGPFSKVYNDSFRAWLAKMNWEEPCSTDLPILLLTELSPANHVEGSAGLIMVTSRVTRITLVTRYLIGQFNLRMS